MSGREVPIAPLTAADFAAFGQVLDCAGPPDLIINQGLCGRYHDRATLRFGEGRAGLSLFDAEPRQLPLTLEMMERHPLGSQAFLPMQMADWLVIVAPDAGGVPGSPLAFAPGPGQGVNYAANTWHAVLTPLAAPGRFAVVDRIGTGANLEEHWFDQPWTVTGPMPIAARD